MKITDFPQEILFKIFSFLYDLSNIALVSQKFYSTTQYLRYAFPKYGKIKTNFPIIAVSNSLLESTENLNVRFLIVEKYICRPALTFQHPNTLFFINSALLVPPKKYLINEFSKRIKLFSTSQSYITKSLLSKWSWVAISTSHLEGLESASVLNKVQRITVDKLPKRIGSLPLSLNIVVVYSRIFHNIVPFALLRRIPSIEVIVMCKNSRFYMEDLKEFSNIVPHISYFKHPSEFFAPYVRVRQQFKIILKRTPKWCKYLGSFRV